MKEIQHTNQEFSPLGNRIKTTVYYTDGTTRVQMPHEKRTKEHTREWMFYSIKRFQERQINQNHTGRNAPKDIK